MKFSESRKAEIRRRRQRRIKRVYSYPIGIVIYDFKTDSNYKVIDIAQINKIVYLLAKSNKDQTVIYKIVDVGKYVKLLPKRVLEKKRSFEISENWKNRTNIVIDEEGRIIA